MVIVKERKVFPWYIKNHVWIRGYIYEKTMSEVEELISECHTIEEFKKVVSLFGGCFSIIILRNEEVWIATDIARTFPVFFSNSGQIISDSTDEILNLTSDIEIDEIGLSELLLAMNSQFQRTAYKNISQCSAGEAVLLKKNSVVHEKYYQHFKNKYETNESLEHLQKRLLKVLDNVFDRCLQSIGERPIILPLSGGYDSRLVAAILKSRGKKNVICYTYGVQEDYEVKYSKIIAEKLGFEWYFVDYTKEKWQLFWNYDNLERREYFNNICNDSSLPHFQDYIALSELKFKGVIPHNAVVLNGFCADLPAGSFVKAYSTNIELEDVAEVCFRQHYVNTYVRDDIEETIKRNIKNFFIKTLDIENCKDKNEETIIKLVDSWFTENRPSKWVVNSCYVYEFFGMEWRLPFWDQEFLDFFYSLGRAERKDCKLYIKTIFKYYFVPLDIGLEKPILPRISKSTNGPFKQDLIDLLKKVLVFISFKTGVFVYNRNNTNNYNYVSYLLFKKLKNRRSFSYRYLSVHQIESLWWCEEKYGTETIKRLLK